MNEIGFIRRLIARMAAGAVWFWLCAPVVFAASWAAVTLQAHYGLAEDAGYGIVMAVSLTICWPASRIADLVRAAIRSPTE